MYQGNAILRRPNPGLARKMFVISAGCMLVPLGLRAFGASNLVFVIPVIAAAYASVAISKAVQPVATPVRLLADARGVFVDDALLTRNEDIFEAYLRPASAPVNIRHFSAPAHPLTVEIVIASGYYQIDGGDPPRTQAILAALGRPVVFCEPYYVPRTKAIMSQQKAIWLATVGPVLLFAAIMFLSIGGSLAYMYWDHLQRVRR